MRLGLVAPARWVSEEQLTQIVDTLRQNGFDPVLYTDPATQDGQLSAPDAVRARLLMDAFADPRVDAVMAVRGGTGCFRLLPHLDLEHFRKHSKLFVGFSDVTTLLTALHVAAGVPSYHGPVGITLLPPFSPQNMLDMKAALSGELWRTPRTIPAEVVREGTATGRLIGGNITLLQNLIGTDYDWNTEDAILFIEDVEEVYYKMDRALWHFRLAGKFDRVKAVIVGEMVDMGDGETGLLRPGEKPYGKTWRQIVEAAVPSHIPLCLNFPCGHGHYHTTLPLGAQMSVRMEGERVVMGAA